MSDLKSLADIVLKFSPGIATALTGPIGGIVASLLSNVFGSSVEGLGDALKLDPNAEFKLKQFELEHSQELAQISSSNYANEVQDRVSARAEDKDDKHFWILATLSIVFTLGFFVFIGMMLVKVFPDASEAHQVFDIISNLGMLIFSFWFGSCHGNK